MNTSLSPCFKKLTIVLCWLTKDWGNEKLFRTQKQVEKNCYDLEAWSILLREAQSKHISEVRSLYEHLITIFPSASRYWRIYIEHEVSSLFSILGNDVQSRPKVTVKHKALLTVFV